jgi:sugar phosphate isomerase/epimerase
MNNLGVMQGRLIPDENKRIQSFPTIGWRKEFPLMNSLGLRFLEWTIDKNDIWDNPILTDNGVFEIQELCEINNVKVVSATADNLMQAPIHKKHEGQGTSTAECEDFLGKLDAAGIEILVWPLVDSGNLASKSEIETFQKKLSQILSHLETLKIKVAFETDLPAEYNLKLLTSFGSKSLGINLDIGNLASYGFSFLDEFTKLQEYVLHVHIKDRKFRDTTVPLGEGDVNWIEVAQTLKGNFFGIKVLQTARKSEPIRDIKEYIKFCEMMGI